MEKNTYFASFITDQYSHSYNLNYYLQKYFNTHSILWNMFNLSMEIIYFRFKLHFLFFDSERYSLKVLIFSKKITKYSN